MISAGERRIWISSGYSGSGFFIKGNIKKSSKSEFYPRNVGFFWKFFNRSIRIQLVYSAQNRNPRGFKMFFFFVCSIYILFLKSVQDWDLTDYPWLFCLTGNNLTFSTRFNKIIFSLDHCLFWHVRSKKVFRNCFFNFLWWTCKKSSFWRIWGSNLKYTLWYYECIIYIILLCN